MSQQIGGYRPPPVTGEPGGQPATQVARDEAAEVGRTAADAGRQVAGTAAEQAGNVAQEVRAQARDLVGEARGQVQDQARTGQQKAAEGVRALSRELREMTDGAQSGPVAEIARQAADRAEDLAGWLGEHEPADLLEEVRSFARRRPGVFLVGMALAGVAVGRLTRGAVDSARADSRPTPQRAFGEPGYARTPGGPLPYDGPPAPAGYPAAPPAAARPVPYDTPTPPRGQVSARPYAPTAAAPPLPPVSAGPAYPPDPWTPPAEPAGRHSTTPVGGYVDEVETTGERRSTDLDDPFTDPYRPGNGERR